MKKLMIAAAVAAMAIGANAGSTIYLSNNLEGYKDRTDITLYLYDYGLGNDAGQIKRDNLVTLLSQGGEWDYVKNDYYVTQFTWGSGNPETAYSKAAYLETVRSFAIEANIDSTSDVGGGNTWGHYYGLVLLGDGDETGMVFVGQADHGCRLVDHNGNFTTQNGYAGIGAQPDVEKQGQWVNVPEPTSGLLMLLGVAGLALKRKRA